MTVRSLEAKIAEYPNAIDMLRHASMGAYPFPGRAEWSNWRDEQKAWSTTAVVFDQSHHMTEVRFRGRDVRALLERVGINSFENFGRNKAKQFVACNEDGYVIGDAVLFGLEDDEVALVGPPTVSRWMQFQAEIGDYDVEITRDEMSLINPSRRNFRWQLQGPAALEIAARAAGGTLPALKTFQMGEFIIAGYPVRALNHSMTRKSGLEIWGPRDAGPAVLERLLEAGQDFGVRQAGSTAYSTTALESGWLGAVHVPAIYSGAAMRPYREWMAADTMEASASVGGSFVADTVDAYYVTPWAMGFGRILKFDHDFIGRPALEALAKQPQRAKVWLRWNDQDVARVIASSLFDDEASRAKYLVAPYATYATFQSDSVLAGDEVVGLSTRTGYTVNVAGWSSLAMVDKPFAVDGTEVVLVWGEERGGTGKPTVEPHRQTTVRAVVSTTPLA